MVNKACTSILLFVCSSAVAQFSLPRFDIEVKAAQCVYPGNDRQQYSLRALESTNLHLAAHVQINQHIAVGWFYSSSMRGQGYNTPNDFKFKFGSGDSKAQMLFTGVDLRLSAGRAVRLRPYLSLNYGKAQIVEDKGSYRLASDLTAFGGSFGLMRRMGNHLYWNIIEIGAKSLSQKLFWSEGAVVLELKTGFTYNIGKRK